jgi:hypothetical protein
VGSLVSFKKNGKENGGACFWLVHHPVIVSTGTVVLSRLFLPTTTFHSILFFGQWSIFVVAVGMLWSALV